MACYSPLSGYRTPAGSVTFDRSLGYSDLRVTVSCGQCWGCRLERSRQWSVRMMHEAQMHESNSFLTLTYDDDQVPDFGSLVVSHWQDFAKRVRHRCGSFRFYHCGEYGETTNRPHYHACAFGLDFSADRTLFKRGKNTLWTSPLLEELWGHGFATIGALTAETAQYVAGYIQKKLTGTKGRDHYETDQVDLKTGEVFSRKPPYSTMSRRPGIGATWLDKFHKDVYPSDSVISKGIPSRPPSFYDYRLELRDPSLLKDLKQARAARGRKHRDNNTHERLKVRERVSFARHSLNSRNTL